MGSDMSKPRRNIRNCPTPSIYSKSNPNQFVRTGPVNNGKHLICKEIDIPMQQQPCQEQQCAPMYSTYPTRPTRQQIQQQIHLVQQQQQVPTQLQQVPVPQPINNQVSHSYHPRENCPYDQYSSPLRDEYREVFRETENFPQNQPSYNTSSSRTRCYDEHQNFKVDRPERYRTLRPCRRDDDDYIERYEIQKDPSRTYNKPTYQYFEDLENNNNTPVRYRSKSSDKYLESKDYGQFEEPADGFAKSKLQSRSVYFIKDDLADNYEASDYQSSRFKNLYDSRSNLSSKRSMSTSQSNSTENLGFKPIGSLITNKPPSHSNTPSSGRDVPVVNIVTNNNDIVYVPMVKTEFIKRESQKIENLGQISYLQQQDQSKSLRAHSKSATNLTKSNISVHNIESILKDELEAHRKNSSRRAPAASSESSTLTSPEPVQYKPILKKSSSDAQTDSEITQNPCLRSQNLRERFNSEFHQVRMARNYYDTDIQMNGGLNISHSNEVMRINKH